MGLLSRMVGMLTDLTQLPVVPRAPIFQADITPTPFRERYGERGVVLAIWNVTGKVVQDICYYWRKKLFRF